jgi:glycosyltransferase involved in cell wall biosynthesis
MNKTATISVVLNTYNAAATLQKALDSVSWADEIVVMDMGSNDDTQKIAKAARVHLYTHPNVGYVEPARNAAISKATGTWIFVLDADELVPTLLATKLQQLAAGDATADAYFIPRKNMMFGDWLLCAGWWPDYQLRFFKQNTVFWPDTIHSVPHVNGTQDYIAPQEQIALEHYNYANINEYLLRSARYTSHEAASRESTTVTAGHL